MKAFLLSAGKGTRLRPLTYKIPKCLISINNKPLLHYWLKLCEKYGVDEVLINLHHLSSQVERFLEDNSYGIKIKKVYEKRLLGSAGTIFANRDFVKGKQPFFIFYTDNLTNINLRKMWEFHKAHQGVFTMGLFRTDFPQGCGIVKMNQNHLITEFQEKPRHPPSNLANAGVYIASYKFLDYIEEVVKRNQRELAEEFYSPLDISYHILPDLVGKMYGYFIEEYFLEIGTWENYRKARKELNVKERPEAIQFFNSFL
ncbi:nucleotidyltransferase family protein [Candidatus Aerophobetes bacterium]|nr:nucleotidyltransferase family protein [Candidatus Aerophobetes bacterium]